MKPSELKAILDLHRLWIDSGRKQGKRANLRDADLRGAYLCGANLARAFLRGANLRGADLRGANLQDVDLLHANLGGADLRGADLGDTYLRGANLGDATFDLNFKKVGWFREATFSENQIAWVCLHPKFGEWESTLKWVKVSADAA